MMKIYEYIRNGKTRTIKLLGITFMTQTYNDTMTERLQSFLGGLLTTKKFNDPETVDFQKDIKILGHTFLAHSKINNDQTYYLLGREIYKKSILEQFKKQYFKYFDESHDDIYIFRANSGETYLTLTYLIDALIKQNNSKNPLLVATKKYHIDIIKMLCPDIPYIYIGELNLNITADTFKIDNFRFFLFYDDKHFKQVEIGIKNNPLGEVHYFKSILKRLNLSESDISMRKLIINPKDEHNMLKKVSETGLNINNFVFLAPEALSCKLFDEDFWCTLINKLQKKGYDVFVNLVRNNVNLNGASNFKTCHLTFAEAFALAKQAKKIVSLRSGFTEFLLQTGTPMDILYTNFKDRQSFGYMAVERVMSGFGIKGIPNTTHLPIRELNSYSFTNEELLQEIMNDL